MISNRQGDCAVVFNNFSQWFQRFLTKKYFAGKINQNHDFVFS